MPRRLSTKRLHWTQRSENKAKLRALGKKRWAPQSDPSPREIEARERLLEAANTHIMAQPQPATINGFLTNMIEQAALIIEDCKALRAMIG